MMRQQETWLNEAPEAVLYCTPDFIVLGNSGDEAKDTNIRI